MSMDGFEKYGILVYDFSDFENLKKIKINYKTHSRNISIQCC
jgi:heme oxygenase